MLRVFSSLILIFAGVLPGYTQPAVRLSGQIRSTEKGIIEFATVYLKGTTFGTTSDPEGNYRLEAPAGTYTLVVSALGYEAAEKPIELVAGAAQELDMALAPRLHELDEVVVLSSGVSRVKQSAYNAIAIDAKSLHNSTLGLANALTKVPGVKLRESGGVGSDMQFSLDGFSGKHIKLFIDGIPQEGAGTSFGLQNIPVNFAERIEVYRGVVPVGFGADALGGVVNIVTGKKRKTFIDASYSYGSFHTHKSYVHFGHTTRKGWLFELNAFQNYSDNDYTVYTPVKELETGQIDQSAIEKVKRFHDTYHNEAVIGKAGLVDRSWADRLVFGFTWAQHDKEIQTGVRQEIVFGDKRRKARSIMPSLEYRKRNFFLPGLDVSLTANYNRNRTHNLDTATYVYNWWGEKMYNRGKLGEQSYQDARFDNDNWNGTLTVHYRIGDKHTFVLNHVLTAFDRTTRSTAGVSDNATLASTFDKTAVKNITGLSYRFTWLEKGNLSVFGKYYNQSSSGPRNASTTGSYDYVAFSEQADALGYGMAGTYFFPYGIQVKFSYEKALRLPTIEELFGDEDLELGAMGLEPEKSHNLNFNLSYGKDFGQHSLYGEGGLIYRNTRDYIRRVTNRYSGGLYYASHENHGQVETVGFNVELRYSYGDWFSLGGNLTSLNIRDNEKYVSGSSQQASTTYRVRMPNTPYLFSNTDVSFHVRSVGPKGSLLTFTYGNLYVHEFPLYWENHGLSDKRSVPTQFSHDLSLIYSLKNGRYNFSVECKNFTDEKLYDNFSLQKAGRAFYGKFRYYFSH